MTAAVCVGQVSMIQCFDGKVIKVDRIQYGSSQCGGAPFRESICCPSANDCLNNAKKRLSVYRNNIFENCNNVQSCHIAGIGGIQLACPDFRLSDYTKVDYDCVMPGRTRPTQPRERFLDLKVFSFNFQCGGFDLQSIAKRNIHNIKSLTMN